MKMDKGHIALTVATVVLSLGAAVLAGIVFYFYRRDTNDAGARLDAQGSSLKTVERVIQDLSKDLEQKFLYYARDPNKVMKVDEGKLSVTGTETSKLVLGSAELYQDMSNKVFRIDNGSMYLTMNNENVTVPSLRVGNHTLLSTALGLKLCDATVPVSNSSCKNLSL